MNALMTNVVSEEDRQAFNDLAADFAAGGLAESVHEREYPFVQDPAALNGTLMELGFLSVNMPSEYGGLGLPAETLAGMLERISMVDAGPAGTIFAHAAALELLSIASDSSDCGGLYELIEAGSGRPLAFQAFAGPAEAEMPFFSKGEGGYLLHGRAGLLMSGASARYAVLPARGEEGPISFFLADLDGEKARRSGPVLTIGMQSGMPADIEFDGAPASLIGGEGAAADMHDALCGRMSCPACGIFLGIMKGSFNAALEYCSQRYQGGRMIIGWEDVRMKLAGMGTRIALAGACLRGLKEMLSAGSAGAGNAAVAAAVHIGNMAADAASEGIQLLGGNGYMKDYGQEKRMRDAKQAQCLLGSSPLRKMAYIDAVIREKFEE